MGGPPIPQWTLFDDGGTRFLDLRSVERSRSPSPEPPKLKNPVNPRNRAERRARKRR